MPAAPPAAMPSSFWPPQSGPSTLPFLPQGLNPSLFPLSSQLAALPFPTAAAAAAAAAVAAAGAGGGGGSAGVGASGQEVGQQFAAPLFMGLPFGQLHQYPIRPGQPNCNFYMRTGSCAFGPTCKFNHPLPQLKEVGRPFNACQNGLIMLPLCQCWLHASSNHPVPQLKEVGQLHI